MRRRIILGYCEWLDLLIMAVAGHKWETASSSVAKVYHFDTLLILRGLLQEIWKAMSKILVSLFFMWQTAGKQY
jgi:hypothetical protein